MPATELNMLLQHLDSEFSATGE